MTISKSDYMRFRECEKNAWMYIHRRELYKELEQLSAFQQMIFEGGNEMDELARKIYPTGITIHGRDENAALETQKHIEQKTPVLFQPVFIKDGFFAALDILEYDQKEQSYIVNEVKSGTKVKKEHLYDLAFQVNLLRMCGIPVHKARVIHANKEYVRNGELSTVNLFIKEDVTEKVEQLCEVVKQEMQNAYNYLIQTTLPVGFCLCVYKGRSKHCVTFSLHNALIPTYSVHDISRIGQSPKKLVELIDSGVYTFDELPDDFHLSENQRNQVVSYITDQVIADKTAIAKELDKLEFPLYFIDYETLNPAVPRFDGYSPYRHIPFQYALYVLDTPTSEPRLLEFLHTEKSDPSKAFIESLKENLGNQGSIIVWFELFEEGRNNELAQLFPEHSEFIKSINDRIFDLRNIFKDQLYVNKDFKGSSSIKKVLPVLCPELTYKELGIQDGGMASTAWNKLVTEELSTEEKEKIISDLKKYCGLDAYAMYVIWKELTRFIVTQGHTSLENEVSFTSLQ